MSRPIIAPTFFGGTLAVYEHPRQSKYMTTTAAQATGTHSYLVHVIDTNKSLHEVRIDANGYQGVKAQARKMVTAQGFKVLYVESLFVI
jgi:hypothetical protein